MKRISHVFRYADADEALAQAEFARLCVLFEDLQLEITGARLDDIARLDATSRDVRRFYFIRRSLATLSEIRGAVARLEQSKHFKAMLKAGDSGWVKEWKAGVVFFGANHEFLKAWRNDFGGHFQSEAARFAIDNIHVDDVSLCELSFAGGRADCRMKFAHDLVAVAMLKDCAPGHDEMKFLEEAYTFLAEAQGHARRLIQGIVLVSVWPRFGGA